MWPSCGLGLGAPAATDRLTQRPFSRSPPHSCRTICGGLTRQAPGMQPAPPLRPSVPGLSDAAPGQVQGRVALWHRELRRAGSCQGPAPAASRRAPSAPVSAVPLRRGCSVLRLRARAGPSESRARSPWQHGWPQLGSGDPPLKGSGCRRMCALAAPPSALSPPQDESAGGGGHRDLSPGLWPRTVAPGSLSGQSSRSSLAGNRLREGAPVSPGRRRPTRCTRGYPGCVHGECWCAVTSGVRHGLQETALPRPGPAGWTRGSALLGSRALRLPPHGNRALPSNWGASVSTASPPPPAQTLRKFPSFSKARRSLRKWP